MVLVFLCIYIWFAFSIYLGFFYYLYKLLFKKNIKISTKQYMMIKNLPYKSVYLILTVFSLIFLKDKFLLILSGHFKFSFKNTYFLADDIINTLFFYLYIYTLSKLSIPEEKIKIFSKIWYYIFSAIFMTLCFFILSKNSNLSNFLFASIKSEVLPSKLSF